MSRPAALFCVRLVGSIAVPGSPAIAIPVPPHPIRLLAQEHTFDEAANDCYESVVDPRGARWGGAMACLKPMSSLEALQTGAFHRVPVMIGATEQDGLGESVRYSLLGRSGLAHRLFCVVDSY